MKSLFYLDRDQAQSIDLIQPLLAVSSTNIDDYVEPFQAVLRSNLIPQLAITAVSNCHDQEARIRRSSNGRDWRLLSADRFTLVVRTMAPFTSLESSSTAPEARTLVALPNDAVVGFSGDGTVIADFYRSAFDRDDEVFDRSHRLEFVARRELRAGDHFVVRASHDVADIRGVRGAVTALELARRDAKRIVWNYDARTLRASFASSAAVDATRMEFALDTLRLFGDKLTIPGVIRIAREHTRHWVRWKAIQTLLHLDLEQGLQLLPEALTDKHAHVRQAARATLENFRSANLYSDGGSTWRSAGT